MPKTAGGGKGKPGGKKKIAATLKQESMSAEAVGSLASLFMGKVDPALLGTGAGKISNFLDNVGSSGQAKGAEKPTRPIRWQDKVIEAAIPENSSVLDLGCGEGELLSRLSEIKNVRGMGVEFDAEAVFKCVERGVHVFQADLDDGLKGFPDDNFDYVVLEETLQTLKQPEEVLKEMLRVGRRCIVSFPNFAYWKVRLDLGIRGRMPVTEWLPHRWYNTPNIHLCSLQDFIDWAENSSVEIVVSHVLCEGEVRGIKIEDNLYAEEALFIIEKSNR